MQWFLDLDTSTNFESDYQAEFDHSYAQQAIARIAIVENSQNVYMCSNQLNSADATTYDQVTPTDDGQTSFTSYEYAMCLGVLAESETVASFLVQT